MEIFKKYRDLKIYDTTFNHLSYCEEEYHNYMTKLLELPPENLAAFVAVLKREEIINNHETEHENPFLVQLSLEKQKIDSVELAAKLFNQNKKINKEQFKELHKLTIKGTEDDLEKNYDYRDYDVRVSEIIDGKENIQYIPPQPREIGGYITEILDFLNDDSSSQLIDTIFIKPMIAHALIAILQPFGNGNTRIARLVQHSKIMEITNRYYNADLKTPILYLSKNYLLTRGDYRNKIAGVAKFGTDESWNKWFTYNLFMIEEQLNKVTNDLEQYKRRI